MGIMAIQLDRGEPAASDPWVRLALAVIVRAVQEAAEGDAGARWWLQKSQDAELFFDLAGISPEIIGEWVEAGCQAPADRRGRKVVTPPPLIGLQYAFSDW